MPGFSKDPRHDRAASAEDIVASLQPGLGLEGRIKATGGAIRVNTHFKGEIVSEGSVVVEGQGMVDAGIRARQVTVAGKIKGNIDAADLLEIKPNGVVLGDIRTRALIVGAGGYLQGQCQMPIPAVEKQDKEIQNHDREEIEPPAPMEL